MCQLLQSRTGIEETHRRRRWTIPQRERLGGGVEEQAQLSRREGRVVFEQKRSNT